MRTLLAAAVFTLGCTTVEIHEPSRPAKPIELDADKRAGLLALGGTSVATGAKRSVDGLAASDRRTAINFWATDCPPCLLELPLLAALHREGEAIAGVSLDGPEADVAGALASRGVKYENLILEPAVLKQAGLLLDSGVPFTLIVGPDHQIVAAYWGPMQRAQLVGALEAR